MSDEVIVVVAPHTISVPPKMAAISWKVISHSATRKLSELDSLICLTVGKNTNKERSHNSLKEIRLEKLKEPLGLEKLLATCLRKIT